MGTLGGMSSAIHDGGEGRADRHKSVFDEQKTGSSGYKTAYRNDPPGGEN